MDWNLESAMEWYRAQGAPGDQTALTGLLREIQRESGGSIPRDIPARVAQALGTKEALILALIRRIPSLRLSGNHVLELCAGRNCGRHTDLAAAAEAMAGPGITVRFVPCMRMCGKGPNLRWDGRLYNAADEKLLKELSEKT